MLRETTFVMGGGLTIGLGIALAVGLLWAQAGFEGFGAWLAAGIAIGLGIFFIKVGRDEGKDRRQTLHRLEAEAHPSDGPGKP